MKTLSPEQRVEHLQKIQSAYSKCKEYSDDKVQLAMQTYEMVRGRGVGWGMEVRGVGMSCSGPQGQGQLGAGDSSGSGRVMLPEEYKWGGVIHPRP